MTPGSLGDLCVVPELQLIGMATDLHVRASVDATLGGGRPRKVDTLSARQSISMPLDSGSNGHDEPI
jgi:hypothetical protein